MMYVFVVPGNGQVLLGMPDMAVLNIINLNIDSIQKEVETAKTNKGQEMHAVAEDCIETHLCNQTRLQWPTRPKPCK